MNDRPVPVVKDLVLVGGGHTHVAVLKRFGMRPVPGVRITVVARDVHTPYSGMLPGFVAGHYTFDEVHIDLARLARFAGARLYHQPAVGLDLDRREVRCEGRPPVPWDLLSINVGSTPAFRGVPGAAEVVVPVKPISRFVERWRRLRARVLSAEAPVRIGVVGAGAGGVELLLAMQHALQQALGAERRALFPEMHLFGADETILPTRSRGVRRRLERVLRARGVRLHLGQPVAAVRDGAVVCGDGAAVALDEILWVTQAGAPPWPRAAGLAVDAEGFIEVDDTLRSTSHPDVFAAGDVAAVVGHPREKAGVFAVRQGPPSPATCAASSSGARPGRSAPSAASSSWCPPGTATRSGGAAAGRARAPWCGAGRTGSTAGSWRSTPTCRRCAPPRVRPSRRGWPPRRTCGRSPRRRCVAAGAARRWGRRPSTACSPS